MSCSDCISNTKDVQELRARLMPDGNNPNPLPLSGSLELTLGCNVRCKHCYILYPGATNNEMNTEQMKVVIEKIAKGGALSLLLTGGETLSRPDFKEIYLFAKQQGLMLSVYTNATLITPDIIDLWTKYPPRLIEVTIYGHTEETYENVTNTRGSYKRFRRGVDLIVEAGLPLNLKSMVLRSNVHEFEEMRDWAIEKSGAFQFDRDISPRLDGDQSVLAERVTPEQYVDLDERITQDFKETYAEETTQFAATTQGEDLFVCGAGIQTFHVDPTGKLHSCMLWRKTPYDLLNNPVDGWREHLQNAQRSRQTTAIGCNSCSNRTSCGRCPAASALESGDPTRSIEWFCEITQERKRRIGQPSVFAFDFL